MTHPSEPYRALLSRTAAATLLVVAAGVLTSCTPPAVCPVGSAPPKIVPLEALVPPPPTGLSPAIEIQKRGRDDIYEQINGGSVSFLENGMQEAIFATYLRPDGDEGTEQALEIYRFDSAAGATAQFRSLNGEGAQRVRGYEATVHDYGVEVVAAATLVRVAYNDGPPEDQKAAARAIVETVLDRAGL